MQILRRLVTFSSKAVAKILGDEVESEMQVSLDGRKVNGWKG